MTRLRHAEFDHPMWTPPRRQQWVMLIDVMGFSAQIAQPERRDRLAGIYNRIVSDLQLNAKISVLMRIPRRWPRDKAEELQHRSWLRHVRIFSDSLFFFYDAGPRRRGEVPIDPTFLDFEAAIPGCFGYAAFLIAAR